MTVENASTDPLGHVHEVVEQALLGLGDILHADHHRGQQVLEDARRREEVGGADLTQIVQHGVTALGTVDAEA